MERVASRRLTEYSHGAGCACKLSPVELAHVLAGLPPSRDPNVLIGTDRRDDAGVYRLGPDRALVATVDFFTPIVDDPRAFGQVAAANSVSDVYVMGARPLFALGLVAFPREELGAGVLEVIVAGGADKLDEAGVAVLGGHSVDDPEPKFGYAVVGEVHPDRMVTHEGARVDDLLYLTKPLGTGVITTAIKRGRCPEPLAAAAVRLMTHLNRAAAAAMVAVGVRAATDVTGYGLLGHLLNLGVGAEIQAGSVPWLDGVRDLVGGEEDFPGGTRRNWAAVRDQVDWGRLPIEEQLLLADAQTSGGILAAVPPDRADEFERLLAGEPYPAARVGRVAAGERVRIV